ncbi:arad-like aldolase/epimerase [Suhomyces tanzawaensis NRRL Y-17324]|uniref:Arad-like aldolase/epimerase n=1 Tax=Suhomyces tanzawaensis NRRL Y-17324 TaxID=984487 RepID=A0A1E4SKA1_9ASCO|nr:arad-like aldolase/epimerase [Suhomyces tanzawaensis NRRL Y-17324]ODV79945.1 arad-like aldolase/epimerase [Suhomyces tanzawaensis NRRL Y-17324]
MTPTAAPAETSKGYGQDVVEGAHNLAKGLPPPHPIPTFSDPHAKRKWILEHLAGAFRVFGRKGYSVGTAGHISVKDPVQPGTFWINPLGKHFSLIKVSDLVHIDEHCNVLADGAQAAVNAAGFSIHVAIHKARPDIASACHAHLIYGKAYSSFGKELEMINQDVCVFYKRQCVFTNFGGVAVDEREGEEIAEALGANGVAAILQNHGLLTVGSTVDEAAAAFTLLESSCHAQLLADASGLKKCIIPDDVAEYTLRLTGDPESMYGEFQPDYELELALTNGEFLK